MRCEDGDLVAAALQSNRGIDDQTLSSADAQIRVKEDNALLLLCHGIGMRLLAYGSATWCL